MATRKTAATNLEQIVATANEHATAARQHLAALALLDDEAKDASRQWRKGLARALANEVGGTSGISRKWPTDYVRFDVGATSFYFLIYGGIRRRDTAPWSIGIDLFFKREQTAVFSIDNVAISDVPRLFAKCYQAALAHPERPRIS